MALLMRYAALRVSDVVTLDRTHLRGSLLQKRAINNGKWIRVNLPAVVMQALERLPRPRGAAADCRFYFSSGRPSVRSLVKGAQRTMSAVFKHSGLTDAHPHRFRHTLATEVLAKGGTIEDVAGILADSPVTIRRHYAKWSEARQARQDELLERVLGTNLAQAEMEGKIC